MFPLKYLKSYRNSKKLVKAIVRRKANELRQRIIKINLVLIGMKGMKKKDQERKKWLVSWESEWINEKKMFSSFRLTSIITIGLEKVQPVVILYSKK